MNELPDIPKSVKVTCKKPTDLEVAMHRQLNSHNITCGIEPVATDLYMRLMKIPGGRIILNSYYGLLPWKKEKED